MLGKSRKGKRARLQDEVKSSIDVKPNGLPAPQFVKSVNISDKAKTNDGKATADGKATSDAKNHPDAIKKDQSPKADKVELSEVEKARIKKQQIAELQQKQVKLNNLRTKKFSMF